MSFNSIFQFYSHYRFGWGPGEIGVLLMVLGVGNVAVQSGLAGFASRGQQTSRDFQDRSRLNRRWRRRHRYCSRDDR